jgi:uncharacterized SAM-binding protein YcdF (DUF218 family)
MTAGRLIAVLGYSDGGRGTLHPICAARLVRAAELATPDDIVVLSGWARVTGTSSEAALMEAAWTGASAELIRDDGARHTAENAAHAARLAQSLRAQEVVVVTSRWHAPRARAAFRWMLRGTGVRVAAVAPVERRNTRAVLRELAVWPLLPLQLRKLRIRSRGSGAREDPKS